MSWLRNAIQKLVSVALLLLTAYPASSLQGWWNGGHLLVADIAYQQMTPLARAEMDKLLADSAPLFHGSSTIYEASTWPDEIRKHAFNAMNSWHFITIPYDPDGFLSEAQTQQILDQGTRNNVSWAIEQALYTLKSPTAGTFEKGLALRLLVHFVGDSHQPVHTASLFSSQFPNGDMGGNLYRIKSPVAPNLHALWDSGLGALPFLRGPATPAQMAEIHCYAENLMQIYPKDSLTDVNDLQPAHWVQESHRIASEIAYQIPYNSVPSSEYMTTGQQACDRQIALAGYRLGRLLNQIFGNLRELAIDNASSGDSTGCSCHQH